MLPQLLPQLVFSDGWQKPTLAKARQDMAMEPTCWLYGRHVPVDFRLQATMPSVAELEHTCNQFNMSESGLLIMPGMNLIVFLDGYGTYECMATE